MITKGTKGAWPTVLDSQPHQGQAGRGSALQAKFPPDLPGPPKVSHPPAQSTSPSPHPTSPPPYTHLTLPHPTSPLNLTYPFHMPPTTTSKLLGTAHLTFPRRALHSLPWGICAAHPSRGTSDFFLHTPEPWLRGHRGKLRHRISA